jgi:cobalamin biosynthesis protein CobT
MKKILCYLLFSAIFLTACTSPDSQSTNKLADNNKETTQNSNGNSEQEGATENSADTSEEKTSTSNDEITEENISEKVKNYIINGQENKPEAQKVKWSNTFLNEVDIKSLYKEYISKGGNVDNLENLVEYITLNAPIPSEWNKLFEKDLYDIYGEKVTRLEHLEGDLYQAYIKKDGTEVPYVVVSSRTGYFHG